MKIALIIAFIIAALAALGGCETAAPQVADDEQPMADVTPIRDAASSADPRDVGESQPQLPPTGILRPDDRVLFVGDDITQQMFYTRAVASGLLSIAPRGDMAFFNGGKAGSTAADAIQWIDELMVLTRPTVVFLFFGYADAKAGGESVVADYRRHLAELIDRAAGYQYTRQVIVISPMPVQVGAIQTPSEIGMNKPLSRMAEAAREVADEKGVSFIGVFEYMLKLYVAAIEASETAERNDLESDLLSIGPQLPSEQAHAVLASAVLWGVGVSAEALEEVGWSPLKPIKMARIRGALALDIAPPTYLQARYSHTLYEGLRRFDEKFFRYWRLAGRHEQGPRSRKGLEPELNRIWAEIQTWVRRYYGPGGLAREAGQDSQADEGDE